MTTETTQAADSATGSNDANVRALNWRTEALYGAVAGAAVLAALCVALLSGVPKPASYTIVGAVCLWLVVIGVDRAIKRTRQANEVAGDEPEESTQAEAA